MKRLLKIITDIFIISLVFLFLCESILYLIGWGDPVVYMRDDKCRFRLAPNQKKYMIGRQININSIGMRGPEPDKNKNNIVFLGDSITYGGASIADDKIFVGILNKMLSDTGYQALNAGVNNYGPKNIEQWFYILKRNINFHYTVLVIPSIDFKRGFNYNTSKIDLFHNYWLRFQFIGTYMLYRSKTFLLDFIRDYLYDFDPFKNKLDVKMNDNLLEENANAYKNVIKKSENILIFIIPSKEEVMNKTEDKTKQFYLIQLSEITEPSKIIDLYPMLVKYGPHIFRDYCHFNEEGHKIIANIIWQTINDKWFSKMVRKEN